MTTDFEHFEILWDRRARSRSFADHDIADPRALACGRELDA
jgi:hypothetical protein